MDATLVLRKRDEQTARLLRHCMALGMHKRRVPARIRLDLAIGHDLRHLLVTSLTRGSR
jgi:hypothetical protein